jgi:lipopolysaccharide biosynthesis glycosyltransferase
VEAEQFDPRWIDRCLALFWEERFWQLNCGSRVATPWRQDRQREFHQSLLDHMIYIFGRLKNAKTTEALITLLENSSRIKNSDYHQLMIIKALRAIDDATLAPRLRAWGEKTNMPAYVANELHQLLKLKPE